MTKRRRVGPRGAPPGAQAPQEILDGLGIKTTYDQATVDEFRPFVTTREDRPPERSMEGCSKRA